MVRAVTAARRSPTDDSPSGTAASEQLVSLVVAAQRGDKDAFAALYRVRSGAIGRYVMAILREPEAAADAVAETFLHAWRDLPQLRSPERFDAWLLRIAHRRALDALRDRRRAPGMPPDIGDVKDEDPRASPSAVLESEFDRDRVRLALLDLAETHRAVLVLRHFHGLSYREIAAQLGKSEEAVRQIGSRAARALRERLDL